MAHVTDRLQALLAGALSGEDRKDAEAHLAACAGCREERDLLASARELLLPLPDLEPRAGFAARVALSARDQRRSPFQSWLRWAAGGVATAAAAAVLVAVLPGPRAGGGDELKMAQRLDLYEDLAVVQNQQALEDLEVVSVLHTLEARP
ncbi:MAG TPA: zf-HC2 domain-containing protein [Myxococcales bacterium]|nr:zf-HC2 domain-containing protein [Myxococcales bacterium]